MNEASRWLASPHFLGNKVDAFATPAPGFYCLAIRAHKTCKVTKNCSSCSCFRQRYAQYEWAGVSTSSHIISLLAHKSMHTDTDNQPPPDPLSSQVVHRIVKGKYVLIKIKNKLHLTPWRTCSFFLQINFSWKHSVKSQNVIMHKTIPSHNAANSSWGR